MSKIHATDHFETQNWEVTFDDLAPNYADLFIGFTDDSPVVEFKDLKFKYELKQNGNIKQYGVYPPPNVRYVRTDQPYIVVERLNLEVETEYELYLWAENGGQSFEHTTTFTTPRPEQPYPSWTWDGEKWNPPVPYPDDGKFYAWDEGSQSWVIPANPININTATESELTALSGVGTKLAQAIIDGRPWSDPVELATISGISESMIQAWDVEA